MRVSGPIFSQAIGGPVMKRHLSRASAATATDLLLIVASGERARDAFTHLMGLKLSSRTRTDGTKVIHARATMNVCKTR
jgi:hypothetical protein